MKQRKIAMMLSYLIFSLTSFSLQLFAQDKHLTSPDPQQLAFVDMNDNRGTFFLSAERMKPINQIQIIKTFTEIAGCRVWCNLKPANNIAIAY